MYQGSIEEGKIREKKMESTCGRLGSQPRLARTSADLKLMALKIKPSEHALVVSELLLHIKDIDDQSLQKLQTAAQRWDTEASTAEYTYWLYMLDLK